jgi:hypothetical protein
VPFWPGNPGWVNKIKIRSSGSWINIPDHISQSLETILWVKILKFFEADPDPGFGNLYDPGSGIAKFGSGIRDTGTGSV